MMVCDGLLVLLFPSPPPPPPPPPPPQMNTLRREIRFHKESERLEYERLHDDKSHEETIMRMYHQLNELRELETLARKDAEASNRIVQLKEKELNSLQKMFDEK